VTYNVVEQTDAEPNTHMPAGGTAWDAGAFVGRLPELLLVENSLAELRDGHGGLLVLTGPPGIGKTRLAAEVADRARAGGCVTVTVGADGTAPLSGQWPVVLAELAAANPDAARDAGSAADAVALGRFARAVRERTGAPVVIVLDGLPAVDADRPSTADDWPPGLDSTPLLLVVTETTSSADAVALQWPERTGYRDAMHLALPPLPPGTVLELVERQLVGAGPDVIAAIALASGGNPGVAVELCEWTLRPRDDVDPSALPCLTAALSGCDDVLSVLAEVGKPSTVCLISKVMRTDRVRAIEVLEACRSAGFVDRDDDINPKYRLTHPLIGLAARALAAPHRLAEINRNIAQALARLVPETPSEASVSIAQHLLAAGENGPELANSCLAAARWLAGTGSFGPAIDFATRGLAEAADPEQECEFLVVAGRCAVRSGAHALGVSYLERAVAGGRALGNRELFTHAVLELLDAAPVTRATNAQRPELVAQALRSCPPGELGLRSRLEAYRAHLMYLDGAPGYRETAAHALVLAQRSGDPDAISFALAVRAANPIPHEVKEYAQVGAKMSQLPGAAALGALPAVVYAAMARGRREMLDAAATRFTALQEVVRDRLTQGRLAFLAAGRAILDAEETDLIDALRLISGEAPAVAALAVPAAAVIWRAHTGRRLALATPPPGLPSATAPHISGLVAAAERIMLAEYGDPAMQRQLTDLVERMPDPTRLPHDFAWATWQAIHARAAALIGDAERCRWAVEQIGPFVDQFVVLGLCMPVGPVGWFVAEPLWLLGRGDEALTANARAERVSRALGSRGWVVHCLIQRGRFLRRRDPVAAAVALTEAQQVAVHMGMAAPAEQAGGLLDWIDAYTSARGAGESEPAVSAADSSVTAPDVATASTARLAGLSDEDVAILRHAATGKTNGEIAKIMFLSVPTIERRLTNMYRRLGVRNRAQAASLVANNAGIGPIRS
jgi:DNA-binding CsgD family transcriptional regulator